MGVPLSFPMGGTPISIQDRGPLPHYIMQIHKETAENNIKAYKKTPVCYLMFTTHRNSQFFFIVLIPECYQNLACYHEQLLGLTLNLSFSDLAEY